MSAGHGDLQSYVEPDQGQSRECFGWLMGYAGVVYRVGFFKEDVFSYLDHLPQGCFFHDDVWLSGYLFDHKIPRYYYSHVPYPNHFSRHPTESINSIPDTQKRHQLPCVEHFQHFGW